MKATTVAALVLASTTLLPTPALADPVTVRYAEGVTRGFPVLRSVAGQKLGQGELVQVARGDRVESRLAFRFADGSYHEEQVVFSQNDVFRLVMQIVAFTPKPRLVKMLLTPAGTDEVRIGEWPLEATRFLMKPQLGMFGSLLVTDLPDVTCWVVGGDAPRFVRFEGPLYFMGPIWRIDPN